LTAVLAAGGLVGFALASRVLGRGVDPAQVALYGALVGVPAFGMILIAAPGQTPELFVLGILIIGFGAGLFGHGTLTATMRRAPKAQVGLALGAWGAVQATAAGIAIAIGGGIRDIVLATPAGASAEAPYVAVFGLEMILLIMAVIAVIPLRRAIVQRRGTAETLREVDRRLEEA